MNGLEKLTYEKQVIAVVCNQWGDSGKGKLVDWLASEWADFVVRGTGGGNAGHTMMVGDMVHIGHTIPCGILNPTVMNVVGNGVAVDPRGVCEELEALAGKGIVAKNLRIAYNAKLILPQHLVMDRIKEANAGADKIGTTGRGIGPVYTDHVARQGMVVNDMLNPDVFRKKIVRNIRDKLILLEKADHEVIRKVMQHEHLENGAFYKKDGIFDVDAIVEAYKKYGERLKQFIVDADELVRQAKSQGKRILLEGAQGHMLSIDYGSYPFVTSSDCSIPGLVKGSGLRERDIGLVLGVVKCPYMTRVGEGPFVTELGAEGSAAWCSSHTREDEEREFPNAKISDKNEFIQGIAVRKAGGEYGATTGRPRRTGWLDLPLLRYATIINGRDIALTKLQVFDGAREIKLCHSYTYLGPDYKVAGSTLHSGDTLDVAIPDIEVLNHCKPNYTLLPGWKGPTQNIRKYSELPEEMRGMVDFIEGQTGARVRVLSMGPERTQTIVK